MLTVEPRAAEVVATLLAGAGTATLTSAATGHALGVLHARCPDGTPLLLLSRREHEALRLASSGADDVPVRLDVAELAPVPDLSLPRAHVVLTGWASPVAVPGLAARVGVRCGPLTLGEAYRTWPDPWLLSMDPVDCELHWSDGCTPVDVDEIRRTAPDPLAADEADSLQRVDAELGERLAGVVRSMGRAHCDVDGPDVDLTRLDHVRAVGMDRYGLDLRCTWVPGTPRHECVVRLPFPSPVRDADEAVGVLAQLVITHASCGTGCPYA